MTRQRHDPAARQAPLTVGERLIDLRLLDTTGVALSLYHPRVYGWPKVIHLAGSAEVAAVELVRFANLVGAFAEADTHVVAITRAPAEDNALWAERLGIKYPLLSDPGGVLHRAAGLDGEGAACTLLFDPVLRLAERISAGEVESQADAALARVKARLAAAPPVVVREQAPALVVPNLLDRDHCRRLMAFWEEGRKVDNMVASRIDQQNRANTQSKVRSDVILREGSPEFGELIGAMQRRLFPEIRKAFNFDVTRTERFRIGCYDAADGGHFAPHRDNTSALTEHRRYALTLNLNTGDYQGGYLRLPEFGPQLYAPEAGGAIVFSCSLLHAATAVSEGRRFVVVGFFWGEAEQKIMERNYARLGPDATRTG